MRSVPVILLLIFLSYGSNSSAAVTALPVSGMKVAVKNFPVEPVPGKRINRLQKKLQHFLQKKLEKKLERGFPDARQRRQAKWSMILGIFSVVAIFTPLAILSLPAAIIGLILGIKSVNGNSNYEGILGIVTSSITLLIFLAVIAVAIFFLGFGL